MESEDVEEFPGCFFCLFLCAIFIFIGMHARFNLILQVVLITFGVCCVVLFSTIFVSVVRDICSYCQLRYEIYQLDRYLERELRRSNVSITPVETPRLKTVIVIQNPDDISLGYKYDPDDILNAKEEEDIQTNNE